MAARLWYYFGYKPEGSLMVVVDANKSCTALPGKLELRGLHRGFRSETIKIRL